MTGEGTLRDFFRMPVGLCSRRSPWVSSSSWRPGLRPAPRGRALNVAAGSPLLVVSRSVRIVVTPVRENRNPGKSLLSGRLEGDQALRGGTPSGLTRRFDGSAERRRHRRGQGGAPSQP